MREPIRILHVLSILNIGGAEMFVMNLYRSIDRTRFQIDFVKHTEQPGYFETEIRLLGGKIYTCPKYKGRNHFAYCKWWNQFFSNHPEYRIIHGHVRSTAAIFLSIAHKNGLTTIAHSHSTSNGKGLAAAVKNLLQLPVRYIADYLFACSNEAGKWLFGEKALHKENYKMIPNAIDCSRFSYDPDRRKEMREQLGLEDCFVLGHVGRITKPKNHSFLLDIFADVVKRNPKARLLLVGDGDLRASVEEKIDQLKIQNKVILVGSQPNTEDYYQAMDVFLFPSLWEGLPTSVVEAQAAGLPCLISKNVTRDVDISPLVHYLPIDSGTGCWVKALSESDLSRRNVIEDIVAAGFDTAALAEQMTKFYEGLSTHS